MELLSGHEKIIAKSEISLNAGTLNRGFTVCVCMYVCAHACVGVGAEAFHLPGEWPGRPDCGVVCMLGGAVPTVRVGTVPGTPVLICGGC